MALCGVLCGLSIVIMAASLVDPALNYCIPMVAGALLLVPSIEFGTGTALTAYAAVSLLSMILLPTKEAAIMYMFLFGIYPIIKKYFERIPHRVPEYLAKFAFFNLTAVAAVSLVTFVLTEGTLDDGTLGKWAVPLLLLCGNIAFPLYDYTLTLAVTLYIRRLQGPLRKTLHIK